MKKYVSVTYRPSPEVFRRVKLLLAKSDGSWQELIDRLIVEYLDTDQPPAPAPRLGRHEAELIQQLTEILRENRTPQMMGVLRDMIHAMHEGGPPAAEPSPHKLPHGKLGEA